MPCTGLASDLGVCINGIICHQRAAIGGQRNRETPSLFKFCLTRFNWYHCYFPRLCFTLGSHGRTQ